MEMNTYQTKAKETAVFPKCTALAYLSLGLAGEAGEVANKVKKILRQDDLEEVQVREAIAAELGDVLWYLAMLADELGTDMNTLASDNLSKLRSRSKRNQIKGSGDNR